MGVLGLGELRETIQTKRDELQSVIDTPDQVDETIRDPRARDDLRISETGQRRTRPRES